MSQDSKNFASIAVSERVWQLVKATPGMQRFVFEAAIEKAIKREYFKLDAQGRANTSRILRGHGWRW